MNSERPVDAMISVILLKGCSALQKMLCFFLEHEAINVKLHTIKTIQLTDAVNIEQLSVNWMVD